jgi:two-component system response regulator ChvI
MSSSKKPLIALVDDDRNILMSMEELLKKEDFNIHTFSDGQSALNSFFKHPPDIAVIDIKMPKWMVMNYLKKFVISWQYQ